jgi:hypothetical protein
MSEQTSADAPREDASSPREAVSAGNAPVRPESFIVDLSSGPSKAKPAAWKRRQKQASAVFTKVMDLSSPAPQAPERTKAAAPPQKNAVAKATAAPSKKQGKPRENTRRENARPSGGATLADLLDPETLARLRGGE